MPAIIVLCLSFLLACPVLLETVVGAVIFSGPAGPPTVRVIALGGLLILLSLHLRLLFAFLLLLVLLLSLGTPFRRLDLPLCRLWLFVRRLLHPLWLPLSLRLSLRRLDLPLLFLDELLMSLHLRELLIVFLSLTPYFLGMLLRSGLMVLHPPRFILLPIVIGLPFFPVVVEPLIGNSLILPAVSRPIAVAVVSSPAGVNVVIEAGNLAIIGPAPIVRM